MPDILLVEFFKYLDKMQPAKGKQIFQDFLVSRAVLYGFSSLKKMEAEAVLFLVALP